MPWKPGESGNPTGRPSKRNALAPALRTLLGRKQLDGRTNKQALLEALLETALSGDVQAIKLIFERVDGKVPEPIEISGKDGGSIEIRWVDADLS